MDAQLHLAVLDPFTWVVIGSTIWSGVSSWMGGRAQAGADRDRWQAAQEDAEAQRAHELDILERNQQFQASQAAAGRAHASGMQAARFANYNQNYRSIYLPEYRKQVAADVERRRPMTESVQRLSPFINQHFGVS